MSLKMEKISTINSDLSSVLLSTLDEYVFIGHLVEHFSHMVKSESIVAYRILEDSRAQLINCDGEIIRDGEILEKGFGVVGHVVRTKRPYFSNNTERDPIFASEPSKMLKREMIVPIISEGLILGTIHFRSYSEDILFQREDITAVQSVINEVSLPLANMKLFIEAKYMNSILQRKIEEKEKQIKDNKFNIEASEVFKINEQEIVGRSFEMKKVLALVDKIAPTEIPVFLAGEKGVGKEMIARKIHCKSLRHLHAFVSIDCTTLSEDELEVELFGKEGIDFTQDRHRVGLLESAHGGTLYLNNVDVLSKSIQVKLLNVINEKKAMRVGSKMNYRADIRFITSSWKDIDSEIENGNLRDDFYYALNTALIKIPALRHREDDIELLGTHFLNIGKKISEHKTLSPAVANALKDYVWPGNVRELQNVMERAYILADGPVVEKEHLADSISRVQKIEKKIEVVKSEFRAITLEELEKGHIHHTLEYLAGNKTKTARALGITVKTLYNKLHTYGMFEARDA